MEVDKETAERIEAKLDKILENEAKLLEITPVIAAMGPVLIRRKTANERTGMDPKTITQNGKIDKYEEVGHRRVFIEVGDLAVIKQRRRRK
jgi:hypothetical protein